MNTQMKTDTWIYYLTIVLGLTVTAGVLGTITLLLFASPYQRSCLHWEW